MPELVQHIEGSLYVDDLSLGAASEKELWDMKSSAQQIFQQGCFNLRKWISNSAILNDKIKSTEDKISELDDSSIAETLLGQGDAQGAKILGVNYDKKTDRLYINFRDIAKDGLTLKKTKKNLLSMSASIYDPYGIISPVVLPLKLLFQKICTPDIKWDDVLEKSVSDEWDKWCMAAQNHRGAYIPRNFLRPGHTKARLVGFSDASEVAYAAIVFLVSEDDKGNRMVSFVSSKSRIAPLGGQTIPRMELLGALILSRLIVKIKDALQGFVEINEILCLSDSTVALWWIKNKASMYKQFVQERVKEIRRNVGTDCWRHIAGKQNPADLPSRGCLCNEFNAETFLTGPDWLCQGEEGWPIKKLEKSNEADSELKKEAKNAISLHASEIDDIGLDKVIDACQFSSYNK
jgi:hypothetical protein